MHPENIPTKPSRILLIDDDPAIHENFRKILCTTAPATAVPDDVLNGVAQCDFQIDSAFHGDDGLEKIVQALAEEEPYAMAIVNVSVLPGGKGAETIARILEMDAKIAVMICTACSDSSLQQLVDQLGNADRLLTLKKPFDCIEVLQLAHAMAKNWLSNQQGGGLLEGLDCLVNERIHDLRTIHETLTSDMAKLEFARQALAESGERLSQTFDACPLPIATLGLHDHRCVEINRAYLDATGCTREEVIGRSPWDTGLCIDTKARLEAMAELAYGHSVQNRACRLVPKDGGSREALLWIEPFDRGDVRQLIAIVREVSQQQEAGDHVPDDLKNVLTVIEEHAGLQFAKSAIDSRVEKLLKQVRNAEQRAAALTRQFVALSLSQMTQERAVSPGNAAMEGIDSQPAGAAPVVLLVDDDEDIRCLAREVLQDAGYHILDAADGHQAIAAWRDFTGRIDLLLTDMVMPGGLSGKDVAECFTLDRPDGKILFSSGYNVDLFGPDTDLCEGVNYLPKPYFARQLLEAVARVISGGVASEMQGV